ncbi:MAG: hypothetical protein ACKV2T_30965 [Kofleriaceae bacterium]
MRWALVASLLVSGCGGEVANPRSCIDGTCTSEAYPFCDLDGSFAGTPELCIAVTCEPSSFAQCRGDVALTCNATGTDYDLLDCPLGCQDGIGCRVCEPNESVCANGAVQTCDALGNVTSSESCPLGCFQDEPRCRELVPSNGLGQFFDLAQDPPDLDLVNALFDTGTGVVYVAGSTISVPNFNAGNGTGPSIRVFVVGSLRVDGARAFSDIDPVGLSGPAIAIIARNGITIDGRLTVSAVAGGLKTGCVGGAGQYFEDSDGEPVRSSGSGGGGHATAGGRGGDVGTVYLGGAGGEAGGNDSLVPLRGGCASGIEFAAGGGGAIQLVSLTSIQINGIIDARGSSGYPEQCGNTGSCLYGGGAGGGILLEAPEVTLAASSALIAKGGAGHGGCALPPPDDSASPVAPTTCTVGAVAGVTGGTGSSGTANGGDGSSSTSTGQFAFGGGGGGGAGRIRVNTRLGTYTKDSTAVEAGVSTAGVVGTR